MAVYIYTTKLIIVVLVMIFRESSLGRRYLSHDCYYHLYAERSVGSPGTRIAGFVDMDHCLQWASGASSA